MSSCGATRKISEFKTPNLSGEVLTDNWRCTIVGRAQTGGAIHYMAAAPPDLRLSYSGSALPFANEEQAMSGGGQSGTVDLNSFGEFQFTIICPNSYYTGQGTNLIAPCVKIVDGAGNENVLSLGKPVPNRSLQNLDGRPERSYRR